MCERDIELDRAEQNPYYIYACQYGGCINRMGHVTAGAPYVHILHYVLIYTQYAKVQQILHRPDTQCHGCALHGIQW